LHSSERNSAISGKHFQRRYFHVAFSDRLQLTFLIRAGRVNEASRFIQYQTCWRRESSLSECRLQFCGGEPTAKSSEEVITGIRKRRYRLQRTDLWVSAGKIVCSNPEIAPAYERVCRRQLSRLEQREQCERLES